MLSDVVYKASPCFAIFRSTGQYEAHDGRSVLVARALPPPEICPRVISISDPPLVQSPIPSRSPGSSVHHTFRSVHDGAVKLHHVHGPSRFDMLGRVSAIVVPDVATAMRQPSEFFQPQIYMQLWVTHRVMS